MKKQTLQDKLNELLGLSEVAKEIKEKATGRVMGISEEEIQEFREIQGIIYFLQAPQLFTPKVCPNCTTPFIVSRKQVAFCSYLCIAESLRKQGLKWEKGSDLEALAEDPQVYNGNEPIWIRKSNLLFIKEMVTTLLENLPDEAFLLPSSEQKVFPPVPTGLLPTKKDESQYSSTDSTTVTTNSTGKNSSKKSVANLSFG